MPKPVGHSSSHTMAPASTLVTMNTLIFSNLSYRFYHIKAWAVWNFDFRFFFNTLCILLNTIKLQFNYICVWFISMWGCKDFRCIIGQTDRGLGLEVKTRGDASSSIIATFDNTAPNCWYVEPQVNKKGGLSLINGLCLTEVKDTIIIIVIIIRIMIVWKSFPALCTS